MYMPIEQVRNKYDGQWVFMVNCKQDKRGNLLGGDVALHGENRASVFRMIKEVGGKNSLTFFGYVGNVPEGVAFL